MAGKVWKKEDELKQLKSELAALTEKFSWNLRPRLKVAEKNEGQQLKPEAEDEEQAAKPYLTLKEAEFDK